MSNEISVEMRLKLEKLKQDAAQAGKDINSGLATSVKGLAKTSVEKEDEESKRQQRITQIRKRRQIEEERTEYDVEQATRRNRARKILRGREEDRSGRPAQGPDLSGQMRMKAAEQALRDSIEAATRSNKARRILRERAEERGSRPMQGPDLSGEMRRNVLNDKSRFGREMGLNAYNVTHPSMLGTVASFRQNYTAFAQTNMGRGAAARMGMSPLAAAGLVTAGALAVGIALKALQKAIQESLIAIERARLLNARVLQSGGMGQGFVIKQNVLAEVLGVSEQNVMQYGNAIAQVSGKLSVAIRTLNETNSTLAATGHNAEIVGQNWKAMWAKVAEGIAEPLNRLYELVSALLKLEIVSGAAAMLGKELGSLIDGFTRLIAISEIIPSAILTAITAIVDGFKWMVAKINNIFAETWIGKKLGIPKMDVPDFKNTKDAFAAFKKVLEVIFSVPGHFDEKAATTAVSTSRMPSSAWEKMGLVIGGVHGENHAKKTADNTSKLVKIFEKITQGGMPRSGALGDLANPLAAQP